MPNTPNTNGGNNTPTINLNVLTITSGQSQLVADNNVTTINLPLKQSDYFFSATSGPQGMFKNISGTTIVTISNTTSNVAIHFNDNSTMNFSYQAATQMFKLEKPGASEFYNTDNSTCPNKIFLTQSPGSYSPACNGADVHGSSGVTTLLIVPSGLKNIKIGADVLKIQLSGMKKTYKIVAVSGQGLQIKDSANNVILTIGSINTKATIHYGDQSQTYTQAFNGFFEGSTLIKYP